MIDNFNSFIQELGVEIGHPDLSLSEEDVCSFECNNRFIVSIEADFENVIGYFYSNVGKIVYKDEESLKAFQKALLQANLCGIGTLGCNLGVDPETQNVILSRAVFLEDLQLSQFLYEFRIFLEATNVWIQYLDNGFPNLDSSLQLQPLSD